MGPKPYPRYGNVPWVLGPGGITPFPLDQDDTLGALAQKLEPMATPGQQDPAAKRQWQPCEQRVGQEWDRWFGYAA